jgi:hypothetical protein
MKREKNSLNTRQMKQELTINKEGCRPGLYTEFLKRIYKAWELNHSSKDNPLKYDRIREVAGRIFCLKKQEIIEYLKIFEEFGYVTIKKRGVVLNYKVI